MIAVAIKAIESGGLDNLAARVKSAILSTYSGAIMTLAIFAGIALFTTTQLSGRDGEILLGGLAMGMPVIGFHPASCRKSNDVALSDTEASISDVLSGERRRRESVR